MDNGHINENPFNTPIPGENFDQQPINPAAEAIPSSEQKQGLGHNAIGNIEEIPNPNTETSQPVPPVPDMHTPIEITNIEQGPAPQEVKPNDKTVKQSVSDAEKHVEAFKRNNNPSELYQSMQENRIPFQDAMGDE